MFSALLAMVLSISVAPSCEGPNRISIGIGAQKTLRVKPGSSVSSTRPDVLEVSLVDPGTVLIRGVANGFADAVVEFRGKRTAYTVRVLEMNPGSRLVELAKFFPCDSTLELEIHDDFVVLTGEANTFEEWKAAHEAVKKWPSVRVTGHLRTSVIDLLFADAQKALLPFPNVKWVRDGASVSLEGERTAAMQSVIALWEPKLKLAVSQPRSR